MSDIPADIRTELHALGDATRQRFNVLYGTLGIIAALQFAVLGMITALAINAMNLSEQLGRTNGALDVLIAHVQMR